MDKSIKYKETLKKIIEDYFRKNDLNVEEVVEDIINNEEKEYGNNQNRFKEILNLYYKTELRKEEIEVDKKLGKLYSKEYGIFIKDLVGKYSVDLKIDFLMFSYLNYKYNKQYTFDMVLNFQNDILVRLDYFNVDYALIIERENKTLEELGEKYNITRERVRQILNKITSELKEEVIDIENIYLFYEDLKLLPKYKQSIILSNKEEIYNEKFDVFIFDKTVTSIIKTLEYAFEKLEEKNDQLINILYEDYKEFIIRYVEKKDSLYIVNDKIYTTKRLNEKQKTNYIMNYIEDLNLNRFEVDEKFVKKFLKTKHGELYRAHSKVESNVRNISVNLEREKELIQIAGNEFLYDMDFEKKSKYVKESVRDIIEENLPINGSEQIIDLFKDELFIFNIKDENIYFILKEMFKEEYQFQKMNIYSLDYEIVKQVDEIYNNLMKCGMSTIINNNVSYIKEHLKLENNKLLYTRNKIYYLEESKFQDYKAFKDIKPRKIYELVILKKDIVFEIPNKLLEKYGEKESYKIWCVINEYHETTYFATKNENINNIQKIIYKYFERVDNITYKELYEMLNSFVDNQNISSLIKYFEDQGFLKEEDELYKIIVSK